MRALARVFGYGAAHPDMRMAHAVITMATCGGVCPEARPGLIPEAVVVGTVFIDKDLV